VAASVVAAARHLGLAGCTVVSGCEARGWLNRCGNSVDIWVCRLYCDSNSWLIRLMVRAYLHGIGAGQVVPAKQRDRPLPLTSRLSACESRAAKLQSERQAAEPLSERASSEKP